MYTLMGVFQIYQIISSSLLLGFETTITLCDISENVEDVKEEDKLELSSAKLSSFSLG